MFARSSLRTVLALLALALFTSVSLAGTPSVMNYQGRLTDNVGNPLNGNYDLTFNLYDVAVGGSSLWTETHGSVSVVDGLFNVLLGETNSLTDVEFEGTERYLGIRISPDAELSPRTQITSVAYAYRVATVDSATGGTITGDIHLESSASVNAMEITQNGLGRGLRIGMDNVLSTEAGLAIANQAFSPAIQIVPDGGGPAIDVVGGFGDGSVNLPAQSISSTEIVDNTVSSDDIAPGAVGSDEIANSSILSEDVGGNELLASNLKDEPGVSQGLVTAAFGLSNVVESYQSSSITCPADGYVLVIASATGTIIHNNGQTDEFLFGVSESGTGLDDDQDKNWIIPSGAPTGTQNEILSAQKIFDVTAGSHTFHASAIDHGGASSKLISEITLSVVYFPTNYGTVQ
jgi:hypothetical protein